jgi:hypothetical protein
MPKILSTSRGQGICVDLAAKARFVFVLLSLARSRCDRRDPLPGPLTDRHAVAISIGLPLAAAYEQTLGTDHQDTLVAPHQEAGRPRKLAGPAVIMGTPIRQQIRRFHD